MSAPTRQLVWNATCTMYQNAYIEVGLEGPLILISRHRKLIGRIGSWRRRNVIKRLQACRSHPIFGIKAVAGSRGEQPRPFITSVPLDGRYTLIRIGESASRALSDAVIIDGNIRTHATVGCTRSRCPARSAGIEYDKVRIACLPVSSCV